MAAVSHTLLLTRCVLGSQGPVASRGSAGAAARCGCLSALMGVTRCVGSTLPPESCRSGLWVWVLILEDRSYQLHRSSEVVLPLPQPFRRLHVDVPGELKQRCEGGASTCALATRCPCLADLLALQRLPALSCLCVEISSGSCIPAEEDSQQQGTLLEVFLEVFTLPKVPWILVHA